MELVLDFRSSPHHSAFQHELERLESLVTCFQMFVGHELPGILAPMQGFARMLTQESSSLDAEIRMPVARIAALVHKADLFSRRLAEIGRLLRICPFGPPVDLAETLSEATAEVNAFGAAVELISGPLRPVGLARPLLHAVLVALLRNAAAAVSPGRSVQVAVEIRPGPEGDWLLIRDNGRGMGESQIRLLDEPFAAARQPGAVGPGLGFFLVRQAAARWGAVVKVSSEAGLGTTVGLLLPVLEDNYRHE